MHVAVQATGLLDTTAASLGLWVHFALFLVSLQLAAVRAFVAWFVTVVADNAVLASTLSLGPFAAFLGAFCCKMASFVAVEALSVILHFADLHVFAIRLAILAGNRSAGEAIEVGDNPAS